MQCPEKILKTDTIICVFSIQQPDLDASGSQHCPRVPEVGDCQWRQRVNNITRSYPVSFPKRLRVARPSNICTFCVSRRPRKMYCGQARLCVCLSAAVRPHYCTDPDVTWRRGRGCPLVVHCWADLQSGHGLRCYGNITRTLVTSLRPSHDMTT